MLSFLAPADVARLGCTNATWRRDAGEWWATMLATLPAHALWPANADPASPQSLVRAVDGGGPLAALAAACDAACSLPATRCGIAHFNTEHRFWLPASDDAAARVASGALTGRSSAVCQMVCWFDVRTTLRLPPGAWLLRWRVRVVGATVETFTLRCEAAADDVARVTATPVPAALLRRGPPPEAKGWALSWRGAPDDAARLQPQASLDAAWTPRLRPRHQPDWQHLPAAVVHVAGSDAAAVTAALFKHSNQWVHGIVVDCLQAVPLARGAASFAPLPSSLQGAAADDPLRREAFAGLPVQPVPAERWAAPHWATTQLA